MNLSGSLTPFLRIACNFSSVRKISKSIIAYLKSFRSTSGLNCFKTWVIRLEKIPNGSLKVLVIPVYLFN